MKATLVVADSAQADQAGKVHALGAGWNITGTPTPPMAVMAIIDCPWDQTNTQHRFAIDLLDGDGQPVSFQTDPLGKPIPAIHVEGGFEVGRPPGLPHGTPIRQHLAINLNGGMPLAPAQNYEFRLTIDGDHVDSWLATFYVLPPNAPPSFPA